jgi:hypothetical protein
MYDSLLFFLAKSFSNSIYISSDVNHCAQVASLIARLQLASALPNVSANNGPARQPNSWFGILTRGEHKNPAFTL